MTSLCAMCGQPMHRYGYPADGHGHKPDATACVNTLRGVIEHWRTIAEAQADVIRTQREARG